MVEETPPATGRGALPRYLWSQLTSMRTALALLFALALGAIPGSLLPQRPVSPVRVAEFINSNPQLGPVYNTLGLFDVYASPWFAAIYLLLFTSLVGCIIPRIGVYAGAYRTPPPRTPRNLSRMPEHRRFTDDRDPADVLEAAAAELKSRRFRIRAEGDSVSAERGQLRELGNLVFHVSLVFLLVSLAWGALFSYKGTTAVVEGQAFSNTLTQYDDFSAGAAFNPSQLDPFTVRLNRFDVKFETGPVQRGAARLFRASVETTVGGTPSAAVLEVNHPIVIGDTTVHLVGHGYAPVVTVRDASGAVAFAGPVVFLPQDGQFLSVGVVKAPDARPQRLAFEGLFLPTAVAESNGSSAFPDALNPELLLNVWTGPPKVETGVPENVFSLNTVGLTQVKTADGKPFRFTLKPGQLMELPEGGSITFDGWKRWTKLQVSNTPGLWLVLISIIVAVAGLCLSLFIRPRRVWLRATPGFVEIAGLDRAEGRGGLDDELTLLAEACGLVPGDDTADNGATEHAGGDDEGDRP